MDITSAEIRARGRGIMSEGLDRERLLVALREACHPVELILAAIVRHGNQEDLDCVRAAFCELIVGTSEMIETRELHKGNVH